MIWVKAKSSSLSIFFDLKIEGQERILTLNNNGLSIPYASTYASIGDKSIKGYH